MQRRYSLSIAAAAAIALVAALWWLPGGHDGAAARDADAPGRVPAASTNPDKASASAIEAARRRAAAFDLERDQAVPEGSAADVLAELAPLADAGDAVAARRLYLKLRACKSASEANLAADYAASTVSPELVRASGQTMEQFLAQFERNRLAGIERTLAGCRGLPATADADMRRWLTQAAMSGDIAAVLMYATDPDTILGSRSDMLRDPEATIAYKRNVMRLVGAAAEAGIPEAMQHLANAYGNGVLTRHDPVMAYAWQLAANRAFPDPYGARVLASRRAAMTAAQLAEAQARAQAIQARCCRR